MKRSRYETSATKPSPEKRREEKNSSAIAEEPPKPPIVEDFERFWAAYPPGRKHSKAKARKAFERACKAADCETIIAAAAEYAASPVGQGEFVKGPEPWLNGECWNDDRAAWNRSANGSQSAAHGGFDYSLLPREDGE